MIKSSYNIKFYLKIVNLIFDVAYVVQKVFMLFDLLNERKESS